MPFVIRLSRLRIVQAVRWTIDGVYVRGIRDGVGTQPIFLRRAVYDAVIIPSATQRLQRRLGLD